MGQNIKVTFEMLEDFQKLLLECQMFMSFNMAHAQTGLPEPCYSKVLKVAEYSNENIHLVKFLNNCMPFSRHLEEAKTLFKKNGLNALTFIYEYFNWVRPIFEECKPDMMKRVNDIQGIYTHFMRKHGFLN